MILEPSDHLTIPITIVTLGIFLLYIDTFLIYTVAAIVPGFHVDGFWSAFFFGLIISFFGTILD